MKCHKVDYEIIGNSMPLLEVELDPGETVIAEAGSMNYMEEDISFETKMGDGADPDQGMFSKLFSVGKRMITGESLFMTHFSNNGGQKRKVAFAAPYPGMVVPVDMSQIGERLYCQKDAFLCAALGTRLSVAFSRKLGAGFFGGEGFILQKLEGDGMAFIQAGGSVVRKELNNETLRVDTGCLVGFSEGIEYDIEMVKGIKSMFLGGEGLWLATISGTWSVWVQRLQFSRLADRLLAAAPAVGGDDKGES